MSTATEQIPATSVKTTAKVFGISASVHTERLDCTTPDKEISCYSLADINALNDYLSKCTNPTVYNLSGGSTAGRQPLLILVQDTTQHAKSV